MCNKRFTKEFKLEAVQLIKERQYSAAEVPPDLAYPSIIFMLGFLYQKSY